MAASIDLDALRSNTAWMTRLARRLVGEADADDLVQDAWMVALREGDEAGSSRGWLRGVVQNLARMRRRAEGRRRRRDEGTARLAESVSTLELVERLSAQRQVTDAVLALPEPVREAILLRYYRGLALREIAREQGVTPAAVHRRVERGHELLRARLAPEHGDRIWTLAILVSVEPCGRTSASTLGALSMGMGTKVVAALAVAGGALGAFFLTKGGRESEATLARAPLADARGPALVREAAGGAEPEALRGPAAELPARVALGAPAAGEAAPAAPAPPEAAIRTGRVVDLQGAPLAALALVVLDAGRREVQRVSSGPAGEIAVEERGERVEVRESEWVTLVPGVLSDRGGLTVVAGRRAAIGGWAVDDGGTPVEGAHVRIEVAQELYRELSLLQPYGGPEERWKSRTDRDGRFALEDVCVGEGLALIVDHPGYRRAVVPLEEPARTDLQVVLQRRSSGAAVWGVVVDSRGDVVPEAYVAWGARSTRTDARGRFHIERFAEEGARGVHDGAALRALKAGHLPAVVPEGVPIVPPVELRLGGEPLSIEGRVVDSRGAPLGHAVVWLSDPTAFGMIALESSHEEVTIHCMQESILRGDPFARGAVADAEGRFRLDSLLDRSYRLLACSPFTLEGSAPTPVRAGERSALLVVSESGPVSAVSGVFVSTSGTPVAGLLVQPRRTLAEDLSGLGAPTHRFAGEVPVTDREGRVSFDSLALEGAYFDLYLNGRFIPPPLQLSRLDDPSDFLHVLPLPCRLQIDASGLATGVDRFTALDRYGDTLSMHIPSGAFSYISDGAEIVDGLSSVVEVDERASAIVLWRGDEEIARRGVALAPALLNTVRF